MTRLFLISADPDMAHYRATLTGEKLGWLIYPIASSYAPVHQILVDPEEGPVVIAGDEVLLVDEDVKVFRTEDEARDAYWETRG